MELDSIPNGDGKTSVASRVNLAHVLHAALAVALLGTAVLLLQIASEIEDSPDAFLYYGSLVARAAAVLTAFCTAPLALAYSVWLRSRRRVPILVVDTSLGIAWGLVLGPVVFLLSPWLLIPIPLAFAGALVIASIPKERPTAASQ
jgi:hypothetical protein